MNNISLTLFLVLTLTWIPANGAEYKAGDAGALSRHLLELSNRKAGICSMPQCGDGKLAVELARESKLLVHAMNEKPAEVATARKAADDAGFLGRTVYVEEGGVSKNPLADWCADLLVIDDASDADLAQVVQKDVRRVLSPYRGVAIVGRAKALGAGLSRAKLEAWLKGLDAPGGKIVEDDFGLWAVATMPPLAGGDDWTHYAHGAGQNRYSKDDVLKYPYLLQWTGKPYYDGKFDMVVAAGGRLFRANSKIGEPKPDGITSRSAYNGHVLWRRPLAEDFGCFGSLIVATPDVVYLKDGNGVLCLDAETGAELKRLVMSDDPQMECRWLALQNGVLVTVLGPRPPLAKGMTFDKLVSALPREKWGRSQGVYATPEEQEMLKRNFEVDHHWFQGYDRGTDLMAFDIASGKKLWSLETPGIDPAKTAISGDRLFFYANRSYASCVDLKTAKTIWKTDAPIAKNPLGEGWSVTFMITFRVGGLASPDVYLINSFKDGHYQAFSARDGKILWGEGHGRTELTAGKDSELGAEGYPVMMDGKILTKGGAYFDPLTGKATGEKLDIPSGLWGGCGAFGVSTHAVHPMCGTSFDRDANAVISHTLEFKAACLSGVVPADGLLFSGHGNCEGCAEWLGYQAFRAAEGISLHDTAADRLLTGKAVEKPALSASPQDWTTYRANNSRAGSSSATVPSAAKLLWTWTPTPAFDFNSELQTGLETPSTQSINVGDRVYFGTATGSIRCLDRRTGKELWNYQTAGRIISAPSFWEGKLYAGSGDGRVYCLNAQDGSLVWRYRVAPVERRIMVFGHLMSAWPVNANVLVEPAAGAEGAVAYAAAGLLGSAGGTYLCALDARTGKPRWETALNEAVAGSNDPGKKTIAALPSATGQLAWFKGNLWLHAGDSGVLIVNAVTGKAARAIDFDALVDQGQHGVDKDHIRWATCQPARGQDIGILSDSYVVLGGVQFYRFSDQTVQPRNGCEFLRAQPDHVPLVNGYPDFVTLSKANGSSVMPAWDTKETILAGTRDHKSGPTLWTGLAGFLDAELVVHPFDAKKSAFQYWNPGLRNDIISAPPPDHQHQVLPDNLKSRDFLNPLLSTNAVIFCSPVGNSWHVMATNRTDSGLLWDIPVPAQPRAGGLSMTRAGDVLVPLVDGRVVCIGGEAK